LTNKVKPDPDRVSGMRCHYCEREAAYEAEQSGVVVGLCEEHFKARVEELAESDELASLRDKIDIESSE
jgi:hypothetical protein